MTTEAEYRSRSFWLDTAPGSLTPRPALDRDHAVDVAIVGGGFTGLWTAYYLKQLRPELDVAVLEAEICGFGASGRNGGWCTAWVAGLDRLYADPSRAGLARSLELAVMDAVDEVGRVCANEGIDAHFAKGGSLRIATAPAHYQRLEHEYVETRSRSRDPEELVWLDRAACEARIRAARAHCALYTPHSAALHPGRLARGLAEVVERLGVTLYEHTRASALLPGIVETPRGRVRAPVVVRATEAYTAGLDGERRRLVPIHSLMIVTEPLPPALWEEIGIAERETFQDARRIVTYGQRTADGRIAWGGRGEYYRGSRVRDRFPPDDPGFARVHESLLRLLPQLEKVAITHRHGGALGVARDWSASVGLDRETGLAWAGGYVGEGVAASNLAGHTLAELICEQESERTGLAWVQHQSRAWEPEPLRTLGVRLVRGSAEAADRAELAGRRVPRGARLLARLAT